MIKKLLLLLCLATPLFAQDITGTGVAGDPYILYNAADIDSIRYLGYNNDYYYKLNNNIDFSTWGTFEPLYSNGFNLDGDGHTIEGLLIKQQVCTGLIDTMSIASGDTVVIKNLQIKNITFFQDSSLTVVSGQHTAMGILCGYINGGDNGDNLLYTSQIKINNIYLSNYFTGAASPRTGALFGELNQVPNAIFYQVVLDTAFIYSQNNSSSVNTNSFTGGFVGIIENSTTSVESKIKFWQTGIHYTYLYSYDYNSTPTNSHQYVGGITGYVFRGSTKLSIRDVYAIKIMIGGGGGTYKEQGTLFSTNGNKTTDSTTNYIIAEAQPVVSGGLSSPVLVGANTNIAFVGYSNSGTVAYSFVGYADTTNLFRYASSERYFYQSGSVITYPNIKTQEELKLSATFPEFDFNNVWKISATSNDGYPSFMWDEGSFSLTSPLLNDVYSTGEDVPIAWDGTINAALAYYSIDNTASWTFIDTLYNNAGSWAHDNSGYTGQAYIRITKLDSSRVSTSDVFFIQTDKTIDILYPLSLSSTKNVGDTVNILIHTVLVDSLSLFYAIDDTTTWIPLVLNLTPTTTVEDIEYTWTLPNIHGVVYLLATENVTSSETDSTSRSMTDLGENMPSQPAICWYNFGGNFIEYRRYNDQSCGWSGLTIYKKVTATISDFGDGIDFSSENDLYPHTNINIPLRTPSVFLTNGTDTTEVYIEDFYTMGDTIIYKSRRYYIGIDSTLYCDDLVNNIDSLIITDFSAAYTRWIPGTTPSMVLYNVQRSKIQGEILSYATDFEALNNSFFQPKIILHAGSYNYRGEYGFAIPALDVPISTSAARDVAVLYTSLDINRDYFRGIDPKARKSGR